MNFFKQVLSLLSKKDKKVFILLFILSFIVSIFESISISAMMFFISTVTNFNFIEQTRYYKYLNSFLGFSSPSKFILFLGVTVAILYILRAGLNVFHIFATSGFAVGKGRAAALGVYSGFLGFYYGDFTANNSAHISQAIFSECNALANVCLGFLNLLSELLTFVCIYTMLLWVNFKMTLALTIFLLAIILFVLKLFSKKLSDAGCANQRHTADMSKVFTEAFGNFKLIKLHGNKEIFINRFSLANYGILHANVFHNILQGMPRFFVETLGFLILVLMVIYVIFVYHDSAFIIPIVSVYALALYRFLPSINKILASYNQIIFNKASVGKLYEYFKTKPEILGNESISFGNKIELKNLTFYYNRLLLKPGASPMGDGSSLRSDVASTDASTSSPRARQLDGARPAASGVATNGEAWKPVEGCEFQKRSNDSKLILDKTNLTVYKGQRVAFVGPSGSGKSTLADLIMGILRACDGQILIDGQILTYDNLRDWRSKIGYIPQQIYLFDGTVAENVVFGRAYDEQKLIHVLKKSNIYDFLFTQEGFHTMVGEAGIKLSGGQKQRIASARALYGDPEMLVLDEATSALDSKTEDLIMNEIYKVNEDKTLIVIAHRLTTIEKCDIVYKVSDGQIQLVRSNIAGQVVQALASSNL
ncbi:MAG: ATP-binding cassette domain-containing protein [bacterium]